MALRRRDGRSPAPRPTRSPSAPRANASRGARSATGGGRCASAIPTSLPPGYGRHPLLVTRVGLRGRGPGRRGRPRRGRRGAQHRLRASPTSRPTTSCRGGSGSSWASSSGSWSPPRPSPPSPGSRCWSPGSPTSSGSGQVVEGRVLRVRERGDDDDRYWHVAVDDGTTDRVRAWRLGDRPAVAPGRHRARRRSRAGSPTCRTSPCVEPRGRRDGPRRDPEARPPLATGPLPRLPLPPRSRPRPSAGRSPSPPTRRRTRSPSAAPRRPTSTDDGGRIVAAWVPPASLDALRALPRAAGPGGRRRSATRPTGRRWAAGCWPGSGTTCCWWRPPSRPPTSRTATPPWPPWPPSSGPSRPVSPVGELSDRSPIGLLTARPISAESPHRHASPRLVARLRPRVHPPRDRHRRAARQRRGRAR